jgi:GNAT superfamily N-acetyltransferase
VTRGREPPGSSDVWPEYREQLAVSPDAIELPQMFIHSGRVGVAVDRDETPLRFLVTIPRREAIHELDGLFVEAGQMRRGVGRALVEDAVARAADNAAVRLEVTAGPAQAFYERVGCTVIGDAQTRFGPAVPIQRELRRSDRCVKRERFIRRLRKDPREQASY